VLRRQESWRSRYEEFQSLLKEGGLVGSFVSRGRSQKCTNASVEDDFLSIEEKFLLPFLCLIQTWGRKLKFFNLDRAGKPAADRHISLLGRCPVFSPSAPEVFLCKKD